MTAPAPQPLRQRIHEIIFEADDPQGKAFDIALLLLIVASVTVVMLESVNSIGQTHAQLFFRLEWVFTIIFTLEYISRIWVSDRPTRYIFSFFGVIDFLSIIPTYLTLVVDGGQAQYLVVIRILRMLRMFRVLKMARHMREGDVIFRALMASRAKITVFLFGVISLVLVIGTLMYLIEGEESGFTSIPQGVYWAIVTISTVGFGDITPISAWGKLLASATMILAYAILAVPTGIVGVELARELSSPEGSSRRCRSCGSKGHRTDASFCHKCGESLPDEDE